MVYSTILNNNIKQIKIIFCFLGIVHIIPTTWAIADFLFLIIGSHLVYVALTSTSHGSTIDMSNLL